MIPLTAISAQAHMHKQVENCFNIYEYVGWRQFDMLNEIRMTCEDVRTDEIELHFEGWMNKHEPKRHKEESPVFHPCSVLLVKWRLTTYRATTQSRTALPTDLLYDVICIISIFQPLYIIYLFIYLIISTYTFAIKQIYIVYVYDICINTIYQYTVLVVFASWLKQSDICTFDLESLVIVGDSSLVPRRRWTAELLRELGWAATALAGMTFVKHAPHWSFTTR